MFINIFRKSRCLWHNVEKHGKAREATDDSLAHAHCELDTYGYKHTLSIYRVSLSLEAPNYCLCIQSNSAGFSFVNTGKQVNLKHARRHIERNLVKDLHNRSVASWNWLERWGTMGSRSNACRLLSLGAYWRAKCTKIHPAQSNNSKTL